MAAAPPKIVDLPADHRTDRLGQAPVAIIIHGTGGTDSRSTLQHGDGRGVSIHALISKAGLIYRMLPDEVGANHAGAPTSSFKLNGRTYMGGSVNRATMGIELENRQDGKDPYADAQLLSMGWEINRIRAKYGPLPILRHAALDPTRRRDPYRLSTEEIEKWANAATLVYNPITKRYRAKTRYISQRSEGGAPYAGELQPGEEIVADKWYTTNGGMVHLADGRGFVLLSDLEAI
jgi:N-acetyl-anhydromuramyl-L-alanine amidase AmpD